MGANIIERKEAVARMAQESFAPAKLATAHAAFRKIATAHRRLEKRFAHRGPRLICLPSELGLESKFLMRIGNLLGPTTPFYEPNARAAEASLLCDVCVAFKTHDFVTSSRYNFSDSIFRSCVQAPVFPGSIGADILLPGLER
jgi:hypothetical protein